MKKLLIMLAVVTAILAVSVIGASAAAGYVDDFSEPPVDGKIENYPNWKYYGAAYKEQATWLEEGMVKLERVDGETGCIWDILFDVNNPEYVAMFDIKVTTNAGGKYVSGLLRNGKAGVSLGGFTFLESNVWYNVMLLSDLADDGNYYYSMFAKAEGTDEWKRTAGPTLFDGKTDESPRMRINWNSKDFIGMALYIDNFEVQEGLYWKNLVLTDDQGTEVVALEAIPENATELTLTADIYNAKTLTTDMITEPQDLATVPVLVLYDENGMMLDCGIAEYEIKYFENTFSVTTELSDYDKEEIASVKLYLWDSMEGMLNVMEPVELLKAAE